MLWNKTYLSRSRGVINFAQCLVHSVRDLLDSRPLAERVEFVFNIRP